MKERGRSFGAWVVEYRPVALLAVFNVLLHAVFNDRYGFHRDELQVVSDATRLDWGYVVYPPVTPFFARVAFVIFGPSLMGLRLFSLLAVTMAIVLTAAMVRQLGGSRFAGFFAALCVMAAPVVIIQGSLFQYVAFDYLWSVAIAYFVIRLLRSEDRRWWLAIGAAIGLGVLTKYTIGVLVAGFVAGVLLTRTRSHLRSPWLWAGVLAAMLIALPNFVWQVQHSFISLNFLRSIHERDVRIGRTQGFLPEQFFVCTNLLTVPVWLAGLYYFLWGGEDGRYRLLFWIYLVVLGTFIAMQGRSYYLAPAYPMLLAGGAVMLERWTDAMRPTIRRTVSATAIGLVAAGFVVFALLLIPIAPVGSRLWDATNSLQGDFREEIGWEELVDTVAGVYASLPPDERQHTGILATNYGEDAAIDLYGSSRGLPRAISGVNSYWYQGYGDPPPQGLIVLGMSREGADRRFDGCRQVATVRNRFGVANEETTDHPDIFSVSRTAAAVAGFLAGFSILRLNGPASG